jgi:integrase
MMRRRTSGPNPVPRLRDLPPPRPVEPPLTAPEATRLLATLSDETRDPDPRRALRAHRDHLIATLAVCLGLRSGALLALRAGDLDAGHGLLLLRGTRATVIELPVPPAIVARIQRWRDTAAAAGVPLADDDPLLFGIDPAGRPSGRGDRPTPMAPSTLYRTVHAALMTAGRTGRRTGPHALRRASAALLYEATGDLALVQAHLGLASAVTALAYLPPVTITPGASLDHFPLPVPETPGAD